MGDLDFQITQIGFPLIGLTCAGFNVYNTYLRYALHRPFELLVLTGMQNVKKNPSGNSDFWVTEMSLPQIGPTFEGYTVQLKFDWLTDKNISVRIYINGITLFTTVTICCV